MLSERGPVLVGDAAVARVVKPCAAISEENMWQGALPKPHIQGCTHCPDKLRCACWPVAREVVSELTNMQLATTQHRRPEDTLLEHNANI